jgi:hypothetical protein
MMAMFNLLQSFAGLDPLLQAVAVFGLIAFVAIAAFPLWRYIQKRRHRRRTKEIWVHY